VRVTGELAELAATAAQDAQQLLANANQALRRATVAELRERGIHHARPGGDAGGWPERSTT
jgi:transposase, IS5 family